MFQPNEWQRKALLTWYKEDNPLHLDPRHPCIKLAGEAGEILDLYGKNEYKPGFSWWNCKGCGHKPFDNPQNILEEGCLCLSRDGGYTPLILDELGDYSYYLRILAYQKQVTFEELCKDFEKYREYYSSDLLNLLSGLLNMSSDVLSEFVHDEVFELGHLQYCAWYFLAILHKLEIPLEQVLELNYRKLNSEPTAHGWKNAR